MNNRHHDYFASQNYFTEYAIGNGVIISTAFGSGGYYSYPDRLKLIWNRMNSSQSSITYVIGESGIGKSALLNKIYQKLINKDKDFLVGFYGKDEVLIGESLSPIYPFMTGFT